MTRHTLLLVLLSLCACKDAPPPAITAPWSDDFERAALGADWYATEPNAYKISGGLLSAQGAHNHPLWLRRALPRDAAIEFDVKSNSPDGDIKFEAWGDGSHHAPSHAKVQYTASGYVFIFGGWGNTASIIAKQNEHGKDVVTRKDRPVEPGRTYHMKVARKGGQIDWFIDDLQKPFLTLTDPAPLEGDKHAHFALSNWESDLWFDNVQISPL
jgi:hypothetical protein